MHSVRGQSLVSADMKVNPPCAYTRGVRARPPAASLSPARAPLYGHGVCVACPSARLSRGEERGLGTGGKFAPCGAPGRALCLASSRTLTAHHATSKCCRLAESSAASCHVSMPRLKRCRAAHRRASTASALASERFVEPSRIRPSNRVEACRTATRRMTLDPRNAAATVSQVAIAELRLCASHQS